MEHEGLIWKAVHQLKHYLKNTSLDIDDLYSEGCIGFIKSYRKFDDTKGLKFSTYAFPTIWGTILNFIRSQYHAVNYPREIVSEGLFGGAESQESQHFRNNSYMFSRVTSDIDGSEVTIENIIPHHDDYTPIYINEQLEQMDDRNKQIIIFTFQGYTQHEIGKRMKLSQAQVSRLIKKEVAV